MIKIHAAQRLFSVQEVRSMHHEVHADPFEGWINTLQYTYDRPEGQAYAIVDAPMRDVFNKLRGNEWAGSPDSISKGDHTVSLKPEGQDKTRITSVE
jgi:hypothetical protein